MTRETNTKPPFISGYIGKEKIPIDRKKDSSVSFSGQEEMGGLDYIVFDYYIGEQDRGKIYAARLPEDRIYLMNHIYRILDIGKDMIYLEHVRDITAQDCRQ